MGKRRFIDAPNSLRCKYVVCVNGRKADLADCGRHRKVGDYCTQHAKIMEKKNG